jgi:RNA polymerase sigma-70 factor (ECF subfamily)
MVPSPNRPPDEQSLIERAQAGDEDAFERIVAMNADRVYGALRRFGLDPGEADDVAQEVFLRAWRGIARFQARAQLSTWLYRIAFNEAQRRLARNAAAALGTDPDGEDRLRAVADLPGERPEARTVGRELEQVLDRALSELPAELRAAVVLRDLEGLSTAEAAHATGVREAAFKSRLHRGRMALRTLLEPYLELDEQ